MGTAIAAVLVLAAIGVPMLVLNAAPQQTPSTSRQAPVPAPVPAPTPVQNAEPAAAVERQLAAPQEIRSAFREAQDLVKRIKLDRGNLLLDSSEPKRVPSEAGTDALIKLYDGSKDPDVRRSVLAYLADRDSAKAADKIRSIAQSDPDPDMRRDAVAHLAEHAKSFDELVSLFQNARDSEMRRTILGYLAESSDPRVLDKLLSIAQSDPDADIRRNAVGYLAEH